jgi:Uma2 family endonuclease
MNLILPQPGSGPIVYPESDGQPMAENTKQLRWIVLLFTNLSILFQDALDVFVGADLFWYPVEGEPDIRTAPDVLVVFGRPKGDRGSYQQWEEGNIPLTVVFEVLSPGNTVTEMDRKYIFYEEYGVEEYYKYDPDNNHLMAFVRQGTALVRVRPVQGHVSQRLGIRFDFSGPEMTVLYPDGRLFLPPQEFQRRAVRLAELGRKARRGQLSPEELAEQEDLENGVLPAPPSAP